MTKFILTYKVCTQIHWQYSSSRVSKFNYLHNQEQWPQINLQTILTEQTKHVSKTNKPIFGIFPLN